MSSIVFSGCLRRGNGTDHYQVQCNGDLVHLCFSDLFHLCGVDYIPLDRWALMSTQERKNLLASKSFAWGYDGEGPDFLAITLLGLYGATEHMNPAMSHLRTAFKYKTLGVKFVKQHYKAFTSEVIANLPDNWTMTMEDIEKWVKEKKKQ